MLLWYIPCLVLLALVGTLVAIVVGAACLYMAAILGALALGLLAMPIVALKWVYWSVTWLRHRNEGFIDYLSWRNAIANAGNKGSDYYR